MSSSLNTCQGKRPGNKASSCRDYDEETVEPTVILLKIMTIYTVQSNVRVMVVQVHHGGIFLV